MPTGYAKQVKNGEVMKQKSRVRSITYAVIAALLVGVLVYAGVRALMIYIPQMNDAHRFEELKNYAGLDDVNVQELISSAAETSGTSSEQNSDIRKNNEVSDGIRKLAAKNSDFVGWLSIDDTVIDYPVMKSSESNPEYYLHRDFDRNYSYSGTLFIGEGCNADSDLFIIYGHNMNAGTMFGSLDSYQDASFAETHKYIVFHTVAGYRVYRVFAAFRSKIYKENEDADAFRYYDAVGKTDQGKYSEYVEAIRSLSLISMNDAPVYSQQMMLLSTCAYHTDDGRFVVAAYRVA